MLFRIKLIIGSACLLYMAMVQSQNLVQNPSFEVFENCPERLGNFDVDVRFWSTPTEGSTDYFNVCSTKMGAPENFNGRQHVNFGEGYAGLYLYAPDDYREYLQGELTKPLVKGKKYQISFYVSLAERSDFAIKEFGILFSDEKLHVTIKKELSKKQLYQIKGNTYNYLEIGYSNFYSDTKDWVLVHTQFVAKGTEKYFVLGNFKNNNRTRKFKTKKDAKQGSYYYIDMVTINAIDTSVATTILDSGSLELDKTHVFQNILFPFDTFQLLESAKADINKLFDFLNNDSSLQITIDGHTDNVGTVAYNQQLSSLRAQVVAEYLIELGVAPNKIKWRGFGGSMPVATNSTEEGRQRNRRVTFVITRQPVQ